MAKPYGLPFRSDFTFKVTKSWRKREDVLKNSGIPNLVANKFFVDLYLAPSFFFFHLKASA